MWFLPSMFSSVCSLSYVVAVAEIFSTVLSKHAEYGHPCFSEDFRGNTLNFLLFTMMFLISLSYTAFSYLLVIFITSKYGFLSKSNAKLPYVAFRHLWK